MKRLSHYDKDLAIVLSIFGSSEDPAIQQYLYFYEEVRQILPTKVELKLAISSKTVLKNLEKKGQYYYTLFEQLASLDRLGYKKVITASINLFPTDEHEYLYKTVTAFGQVNRITQYNVTSPLFAKPERTSSCLKFLNDQLRLKYDIPNILYVAHGTSNLASAGNQAYTYVKDYLKSLSPNNFLYTIEGAFAYTKECLIQEIENQTSAGNGDILIVPLLLVTGNHSKNDIQEIKNELSEHFSRVEIPDNFLCEGNFSLLKIKEVRDCFKKEIQEAVKKENQ